MKYTSRKSLHLEKDINRNEIISENHLQLKRPGTGLSYEFKEYLIGKKASKSLKAGHKISLGDVF